MRRLGLVLAFVAGSGAGPGPRPPAQAGDTLPPARPHKETARGRALLGRGLVVYGFGGVDPTAEAYALTHLPFDMDLAVASQWKLETRRVGGEGNERWVLSTYRVTGKQADGTPIDQVTLETVILRRSGGLFRIVHFHWSTSDAGFQARSQGQRTQGAAPR